MDTQDVVSKKQKVSKIVSYVINVISIIIMLFAVFIVITSLSSKDRGYTVYFGRAYVGVETNSMAAPEGQEAKWDNFNKGDMICFRVIGDEEKQNLEIGTVITFWDYDIGPEKQLNTHRIVARYEVDGVVSYETMGDNNDGVPDARRRLTNDIQGVYVGKSVVIGQCLTYIQSRTGFAIFIVLPCLLIMIYCAVLVILNLMRYSREKAVLQHEDNVDALKAQIKEQLLKEMAEKDGNAGGEVVAEEKEEKKEEVNNIQSAQEDAEQEKIEEADAEVVEEQPKQDETNTDEEK